MDAVSGVAHHCLLLAEALADRYGAQVLLATCGNEPLPGLDDSLHTGPRPGGGGIDLQQVTMPLESEGADEEAYLAGRRSLLNLALEWRAHVLHANEHHLGMLGASGLPVLVCSHRELCTEQSSFG